MSHHCKHRMPPQIILIALTLAVTVVLTAIAGTRAWLYYHRELGTMTKIQFSELNLEGKDDITVPVDLGEINMTANGEKRMPFRIVADSGTRYILQIGHTTNLPLDYKIQRLDGWDGSKIEEITGSNLNLTQGSKVATDAFHLQTYNADDSVQKNAEPVYWQSSPCTSGGIDYYVLIVSWTADVTVIDKETEMIYLTAGLGGYTSNETTDTNEATQ